VFGSYLLGRIAVLKKTKLILGLTLLALAFVVGWQIASSELAYFELRADLRDIGGRGVRQSREGSRVRTGPEIDLEVDRCAQAIDLAVRHNHDQRTQ